MDNQAEPLSPADGSIDLGSAAILRERNVSLSMGIIPQAGCATCGTEAATRHPTHHHSPNFVYAIGRVETRFPNMALEKEFAQAAGRSQTAGKTDHQAFHAVLSSPENRYIARQLCWVFRIQEMDTYILIPQDAAALDQLIEAVRPNPEEDDMDVVIGKLGPLAPSGMCNGLTVPIVVLDQMYSFDRETLMKEIPLPKGVSAENFGPAASELFRRIMQLADNAGATAEDRALNYLAMRYPAIYAKTVESFASDAALTSVEVRPSPLSGARQLVDVIFSYTNRKTDFTDQFFVRVDVTEEFPFLVRKLSTYFPRESGLLS